LAPVRSRIRRCRALPLSRKGRLESKPLITIVDDDESVREALKALMESTGFAAETFASAAEFLASHQLAVTACLIADVNMPRMTGFELHRELLASGKDIPTILITAYPDERDRLRVLDEGGTCYLAKPFSEAELLDCVYSGLARTQAH
jgi:FixJ family two-component response regulator